MWKLLDRGRTQVPTETDCHKCLGVQIKEDMKYHNENQCLREIISEVKVRTWCVLSPLLQSLPLNIPLLILTQQNVCVKSSFLGLKLSGYLGLEWDWCLLLVWRGLCISIFKAISQQGFYLSGAPLQGLVIQKMQRTNKSLRAFTWTEQNSLAEMQEKEQNSEHIY